ncbi:MAG: hypothetical protein WCZ18_01555 [Ottowia sp.]|nr:hypothetical protein [Ottowia sp.]
MSKLNVTLPAIIASLFVAGGATAASLQPAAGEQPYFNEPVVASSTVSRAEVAAQAAAQMPAAGEMTATADVADSGSTVTRAQVRDETAAAASELGHFPAASGMHS